MSTLGDARLITRQSNRAIFSPAHCTHSQQSTECIALLAKSTLPRRNTSGAAEQTTQPRCSSRAAAAAAAQHRSHHGRRAAPRPVGRGRAGAVGGVTSRKRAPPLVRTTSGSGCLRAIGIRAFVSFVIVCIAIRVVAGGACTWKWSCAHVVWIRRGLRSVV